MQYIINPARLTLQWCSLDNDRLPANLHEIAGHESFIML